MNALESDFREYQIAPDDECPVCFDEDVKPMPCTLITFCIKYLNKLIYTLFSLVLNALHNLLNFYF